MSEPISLVIVPVDGSPSSQAAARHASLLARLLETPLQLLHVMPLNPAELSDIPANRQAEADHDRARRQDKATEAFARARKALDPGLAQAPDEVLLEDASFVRHPDRAILEHADQQAGCLLVLGARQLSDVGKFMKGSISNEVVHQARCPVTIVHAKAGLSDAARLGQVLVPVDGSTHCLKATALAGELARHAEVAVELVFCRPDGRPAGTKEKDDSPSGEAFRRAREALGEVPHGIEEVVSEGEHVPEAIVARARHHAEAAPMVVMGRRGLGKWQSSLLGSVSHRVIDLAPCPVTVVT
ncbi:universal stress protein [Halomonas daqiaonensis]|uniref:Nucleotide-binding universal stress protein, UspA family n=1 Tax=Halomonas daqiaonensis TaxID=650850 RepID=A0A1H7QRY8_9GAMM|nr:universal stress protein [Halomonas daqiaonensis]SEL50682.1 Nucleotide-binding universal stress protein, UspA family [Halomonas daqiaonensis]